MFKDIEYNAYSKEMLDQLQKGAFLTVKDSDKLNTMTIGWGTLGFMWKKPILVVAVRYSRYTYEMLEKAKEFTVSVPLNINMAKELGICGTKSGRDVDKFKECGLTTTDAKVINTPIIEKCDLHYECKVVYQQAMEPALVAEEINESAYGNKDYHVIYYGEIVASYIKE